MHSSSGNPHFDSLRDTLARDVPLRGELERALQVNVDRVNPSDRGNRFVVGGTVEWILAAAAWAAGVLTLPGGHGTDGFDLMDLATASRGLWSVKSQSARSRGDFRISNGLGGAGQGFREPTIFLSPHLPGLVFVEPSLHVHVTVASDIKGDATTVPFRVIRDHAAEHPACVAPLRVPLNEGKGTENPFLEYAKTILVPSQFPRLSEMFRRAEPTSGSVAEVLRGLAVLHASGELSDEEYRAAKAHVLRD